MIILVKGCTILWEPILFFSLRTHTFFFFFFKAQWWISDWLQTVSKPVSGCSQPLEATKEIPLLSIGVYFQYPPSHKSARKISLFSQRIWSSKQPLRKNQTLGATAKHIWFLAGQLLLQDSFFQSPNTFQSVKFISPPLQHRSASPGARSSQFLRSSHLLWGPFYCWSCLWVGSTEIPWMPAAWQI